MDHLMLLPELLPLINSFELEIISLDIVTTISKYLKYVDNYNFGITNLCICIVMSNIFEVSSNS